jgi:hypothetical protein
MTFKLPHPTRSRPSIIDPTEDHDIGLRTNPIAAFFDHDRLRQTLEGLIEGIRHWHTRRCNVVKQDFAERGQRERVMVVKAGLTRDRREASERLAANRERG